MGKKGGSSGGGSSNESSEKYAETMANIAQQYWGMTQPLLGGLTDRGMDFLGLPSQPAPTYGTPMPSPMPWGDTGGTSSFDPTLGPITGIGGNYAPRGGAANRPQTAQPTTAPSSGVGGMQRSDYTINYHGDVGDNPANASLKHRVRTGIATPAELQRAVSIGLVNPSEGWAEEKPKVFDVTASPMWDPTKMQAERSFDVAMDNILSQLAVGGGMNEAITDLNIGKASTLTSLAGQIAQDEYNKIYGLAAGAPQTTLGGLGGASSAMASLAGQQAQASSMESAGKAGGLGSLGSGLGFMIGAGK